MKKNVIFFLFVVSFCSFISCKNKKINNGIEAPEEKEVKKDPLEYITEKQTHTKEVNVEDVEIKSPVSYVKQYSFEPIENFDNNLFSVVIDDNNSIDFTYDGYVFLVIDDMNSPIEYLYSHCGKEYDYYSEVVDFSMNGNRYNCIMLFSEGILKLYKSELPENLQMAPLFKEKNRYLIFDHFTLVRNKYYDPWYFKEMPAQYIAEIDVYDMELNQIVYSVNKPDLHEKLFLYFENIIYDDDGFVITLGCYPDSDEYVTFKLFTEDNNFNYEIYDKYSYAQDD